jgi:hypothetical protein
MPARTVLEKARGKVRTKQGNAKSFSEHYASAPAPVLGRVLHPSLRGATRLHNAYTVVSRHS